MIDRHSEQFEKPNHSHTVGAESYRENVAQNLDDLLSKMPLNTSNTEANNVAPTVVASRTTTLTEDHPSLIDSPDSIRRETIANTALQKAIDSSDKKAKEAKEKDFLRAQAEEKNKQNKTLENLGLLDDVKTASKAISDLAKRYKVDVKMDTTIVIAQLFEMIDNNKDDKLRKNVGWNIIRKALRDCSNNIFREVLILEKLDVAARMYDEVQKFLEDKFQRFQSVIAENPTSPPDLQKAIRILDGLIIASTQLKLEKIITEKHKHSEFSVPLPTEQMPGIKTQITLRTNVIEQIAKVLLDNKKKEVLFSLHISPIAQGYIGDQASDFIIGQFDHVNGKGTEPIPGTIEVHTHHEGLQDYHHGIDNSDVIAALDAPCWVDPLTKEPQEHRRIFGVITVEVSGILINKKRTLTLQLYQIDLNEIRKKMDDGQDLGPTFGVVRFGFPFVITQK